MKNVLTLFRRDFTAYFISPVGYIYMIVFLLISVGLYMTTFFTFPTADMRAFFGNLPILLCIFIPAVSMRVWAEERKENTWEMLLTFPMRAWELVIGKYLATLAFFVLTVAATITVPLMLISLGRPDIGAIIGGYIGTLLLGAFFLAIGLFISGLCKDQIVAFVVSLLVCFAIYLVGTEFVASKIDSFRQGLGTALSDAVGLLSHYNAFTRGVLEVKDALYFLAWTALFLVLNMMYVDARSRAGARTAFTSATVICIGIGLAFNWLLVGQSLGRFDITENKIYTVSDATRGILRNLERPVEVKLYITPRSEMPTSMSKLEQDITDKLDEMAVASAGKLNYSVVHLRAANVLAKAGDLSPTDDAEEQTQSDVIEERMLDKGVAPFEVQALDQDQITHKLVYSSIGVGYGAAKEEIIPQIMPQNLQELEYRLVNAVYKLTREKPPVVALVAPEDMIPPEMRQMYMQMGQQLPPAMDPYRRLVQWLEHEKYDVRRVSLTQDSPLPDEYDTLVIISPQGLNDRQRWEIARALHGGKPVFLAVQNYEWDYRISRNQLSLSQNELNPGVNELIENYGVSVAPEILMDVNHVTLNVSSGGDSLAQLLGIASPINLPMHVVVTADCMNTETSITGNLSNVFYLWGSPLSIDEDKINELGLELTILMTSTDQAWTLPGAASTDELNRALMDGPIPPGEQRPLMAMLTGQFPDPYKDQPRPAWPPIQQQPGMPPAPEPEEEGEPEPIAPQPSTLIVLGCAQPFNDSFLQSFPDNLDLFLNSIDAVTLGKELIEIRGKKPVNRSIAQPDAGTKLFWNTVNYAAVNVLIAAIGIGVAINRKRSRAAYAARLAATESKRNASEPDQGDEE